MPDTAPLPVAEAVKGHNSAAFDIELLPDQLAMDHADIVARNKELSAALDRAEKLAVDSDASAATASDFVKQLGDYARETEKVRVTAKEPFTQGGKIVDGFFRNLIEPIEHGRKGVLNKLTAYQVKRENERRAAAAAEEKKRREEAEFLRKKAEEDAKKITTEAEEAAVIATEAVAAERTVQADIAAATAGAKASDLTRVRGNYGSSSSLRKTKAFRITDLKKVPREYLMLNEAAIKAYMKTAPKDSLPEPVEGIEFYYESSAVVR